jgi:hypothetical protein
MMSTHYWVTATMDEEDYRKLKQDTFQHAYTSEQSLVTYARYLRMGGAGIPKGEVDAAVDWLRMHSNDIDGELYDRDGQSRFRKAEVTASEVDESVDVCTEDGVLASEVGMYYTAELSCNQTDDAMFGQIAKSIEDPEQRAAFRALGPRESVVRNMIRIKRGRLYEQHAERQAKRLRWLGMEEYDAVAKADEHLRQGVKLSKAESNANPLPPLERVSALLSYDSETGVFVRAAPAGRAKAGDAVRIGRRGRISIDGQEFYASRLAVLLMTGSDPASATVDFKNGDRTDLRWENLTVEEHTMRSTGGSIQRKRVGLEDRFDSVVKVQGKAVTIGTYRTERQAEEARRLFKRSLELG